MNKKIIISKDVMFLEDLLIYDGDKLEKPKSSVYIAVSLDIVPLHVVHNDHGEDEEQDHGENVNNDTPIVVDVEPAKQVE